MIKFIIACLFSLAYSQLCHSSCKTCDPLNPITCTACDTTAFMLMNSFINPCIEIPQYTLVLEMIDSGWAGGTRYLDGIQIDAGEYTPINTFGYASPPLTIWQLTYGTPFIGFVLLNLPQHYKIQVRTHGVLDSTPNCSWFQFDLWWGPGVQTQNVSTPQWQNVVEFNDTSTTLLEIKYNTVLSDYCLSMTIIDATIVAFICSTNCTTCSNYSVCTSCGIMSGTLYYLSTLNQCVQICSNSYFNDLALTKYFCDFCDISCSVCIEISTNCTSCNVLGGYVLAYQNNTCLSYCPDGQFNNATINACQPCNSNCLTCVSSANNCLSCGNNTAGVMYLSTFVCVYSCPYGTYANVSSNLCIKCDISCAKCSGPTNQTCQSCRNDTVGNITTIYNLQIGQTICSSSCPSGQYINTSIPNLCQPCTSNCITCQISSTNCLSCPLGYFLYNGACENTCIAGTYGNVIFMQCLGCHFSCATCTGPSNITCQSCKNNTVGGVTTIYYLELGQTICNAKCPSGQFVNPNIANICQYCASNCVTCQNSSISCLTCAFGYYLYNNSCLYVCVVGTYQDLSSGKCVACHVSCASCINGSNSSCSSCKNNTGIVYYLQLGTMICSTMCPNTQVPQNSTNLCVSCAQQCATCSIITTNCTSCYLANGVTLVYLQNQTCVQICAAGTYATTLNTCDLCSSNCLTCVNSSIICLSCGNVSTSVTGNTTTTTTTLQTVYYLNSSYAVCNISCSKGFVGINTTNTCVKCQTGCVTCQFNISFCQKCQIVGIIKYYFSSNSCVQYCPDGTYKNDTDLTCYACGYYTLDQQCVQSCPNGYTPMNKTNVLVCIACIVNCATQETIQNQPFIIQTKVSSTDTFQHRVKFPAGLSQTSTTSSIARGLQVNHYIKNRRLLITSTAFTIISVSISADYSTIIIVTNSMEIDISTASVGITFSAGSIVSSSGIIYNSLSSYIALENPTFISSYYQVYIYNKNNQFEGIFFIFLSSILLITSLFVQKQETTNNMINFIQTIQIIGLLRVRQFPVILTLYDVITGFSYLQLLFIPNPIINISGLNTNELAIDSAILTYGSQNLINNFGSIFFIIEIMEIMVFIAWIACKQNQAKLKVLSSIAKVIVEFWIIVLLYGSIFSLLSLVENDFMGTNSLYFVSILVSIIIAVGFVLYLFTNFKSILQSKFFRVSNFFKVISLIALSYRFDVGVVCFNTFEVLLIILEIIFYHSQRRNVVTYFGQKILILAIIDCCLFITVKSFLLFSVGALFAAIASLKLYQVAKQIFLHFRQKILQQLQEKPSQSIKSQSKINLKQQSNIFDYSQNIIYQQTPQQQSEIQSVNPDLKNTSGSNNKLIKQVEILDDSKIDYYDDTIQTKAVTVRRRMRAKQVKEVIVESIQQSPRIEIVKIEEDFDKNKESTIVIQIQDKPQPQLQASNEDQSSNVDQLSIVQID